MLLLRQASGAIGGDDQFQWAPTLGGECYREQGEKLVRTKRLRFNGHPPLGVSATVIQMLSPCAPVRGKGFQWAPTLGGECYRRMGRSADSGHQDRFNGHPPLGVNATNAEIAEFTVYSPFQWAPTLGGECYECSAERSGRALARFQWAPTLGGECYSAQRDAARHRWR